MLASNRSQAVEYLRVAANRLEDGGDGFEVDEAIEVALHLIYSSEWRVNPGMPRLYATADGVEKYHKVRDE